MCWKVKGVGPYTAAAIASFAFNEPKAVVDGNVYRVLSRIYGIDKSIDNQKNRDYFNRLATSLLNTDVPGIYNQAIMDFGATICKPVPVCIECPFKMQCKAYQSNKVLHYPVKEKKTMIRSRWFQYLVISYRGKLCICQRTRKDIWQNLFEFPVIESGIRLTTQKIKEEVNKKYGIELAEWKTSISPVYQQRLSHQLIHGRFLFIDVTRKPGMTGMTWVDQSDLNRYPFPKLILQFLSNTDQIRPVSF